ncbi:putative biosynthetic protein (TIGR04099 family) [Azorhizobium sp. AG788]|uniref:Pnap_2097 family protein n=1 Tax=Azorhizobium sp. AG788 TaxID=2183897 RepID=UPI00105EC084|nr:Pnap_2097 family protein [Azorhizobium sp. AG788]TDT96929.1 putative biosynthetic protein (TIGR04099 family) [Azorhizobium sp. AG788]
MSVIPFPRRSTAPDVRSGAVPGLDPEVMVGMPHLGFGGLSETWLLKECGHRHWLALAQAAGQRVPDFRDAKGAPVYAAFCGVSLANARLDRVAENDTLIFASTLARISATQFVSRHSVRAPDGVVAELELVSVFVKRQVEGRNRSVARVRPEGLPPLDPGEVSRTSALAAALRGGEWDTHMGFARTQAHERARLMLNPTPSQDFNGAHFLYFAAFQAFADRAEWELLAPPAGTLTLARDLVYHGNIEPGERLAAGLLGVRETPSELAHWLRLAREDGTPLADIFTRRALPPIR